MDAGSIPAGSTSFIKRTAVRMMDGGCFFRMNQEV
jgi:hypothetical protein